jgi:hypothetical protein
MRANNEVNAMRPLLWLSRMIRQTGGGVLVLLFAVSCAPVSPLGGRTEGKLLVRVDRGPVDAANAGVDLVGDQGAADIYVSSNDFPVVQIAARLLAGDVERVTGIRPRIMSDASALGKTVVLIGTLGQSVVVDGLVKAGKLDAGKLRGKWETFGIQALDQPLPGVAKALVIAGSDRRGTAYGVMELSRGIGVSPWHWWSDVPVAKHSTLEVGSGTLFTSFPSIRYRGIFINDEWFAFYPWVIKTFDPGAKDVGPRVYEKIFELMLRLRLNILWPSMCSSAKHEFSEVPGNLELADQWGIVVGSSHCEPMLRNPHYGAVLPWRYDTNRVNILAYWEESARSRGKFEAVWTVGMRGIDDEPFEGPETLQGKAALLEKIIADQRDLLAKHVQRDRTSVPQCFMPYADVLAIYDTGMKVPEDVTIVWPNDNWGNIRRLPDAAERRRSGGHGVYYHADYFGPPGAYTWFNSTPPARIWSEMRKAWDNGVDRLWVLNVGDIKSQEISMDFWARLAWNVGDFGPDSQSAYLRSLAAEWFGPAAEPVAGVWSEFFRLCFIRKPEHVYNARWLGELGAARRGRMRKDYEALLARVDSVKSAIPAPAQDAYFATVLYPVKMLCAAGLMALEQDRSLREAAQPGVAQASAAAAKAWQALIARETESYNEVLAGGKWRHMMVVTLNGYPTCPQIPYCMGTNLNMRWVDIDTTFVEGPAGGAKGRFIGAAQYARKHDAGVGAWKTIEGIGWEGLAVALLPMNASNVWDLAKDASAAPHLDYDFEWGRAVTNLQVEVHVLPSFRLHAGLRLRVAASLDGAPLRMEEVPGSVPGEGWTDQMNPPRVTAIVDNRMTVRFAFPDVRAGARTLRLWTPDPGVVLDQIELKPE